MSKNGVLHQNMDTKVGLFWDFWKHWKHGFIQAGWWYIHENHPTKICGMFFLVDVWNTWISLIRAVDHWAHWAWLWYEEPFTWLGYIDGTFHIWMNTLNVIWMVYHKNIRMYTLMVNVIIYTIHTWILWDWTQSHRSIEVSCCGQKRKDVFEASNCMVDKPFGHCIFTIF